MKCHYEVLGVSRDADDSEIKTAYRKLALRWHPDKNLNDPEEAKEQFQFVQQAYEVLSDPHERSWYDNHREQILRGKNSDYQENCLDLFQYFTASCFRGYGDDPAGFYHIYADVFEKIAAEDAEFMDDEELIENIPKFGNSQSSYESVVGPFYAYWQSYCTKKSYAWLCPYNINEIKDRRILREIEKEMKKIVQKARRERNEEVRNLVSFVRKRDKRVQLNKKLLEEKAALNRQKQEQNRLEQLRKRKKELEEIQKSANTTLNDSYEEQLRQLEQEYGDSDSEDYSDVEEDEEPDDDVVEAEDENEAEANDFEYLDSSYCVACNKAFSNENAFLNHQSSKKHRINVEILKETFRDEKEALNEHEKQNGAELRETDTEEEEEVQVSAKQKGRKNKKTRKSQVEDNDDASELPDLLEQVTTEENDWDDSTKSKKKQKSKKVAQKKNTSNQPVSPKSTNPSGSENSEKIELQQIDVNHICVTCKDTFESKNKLFAHLKKTSHGVYIPKKNSIPIIAQNEKPKKGKRNK